MDTRDPCPNDIILAVDTSFCNENREVQIRQTVKSLVNSYAESQRLGAEADNLRLSVVTFDSEVEVLYSFEQYERDQEWDGQHLDNLIRLSENLEIKNEVKFEFLEHVLLQLRSLTTTKSSPA